MCVCVSIFIRYNTPRSFNIAIENGPRIVELPINDGDFVGFTY